MTPIDAFERTLPDILGELGRRDASDLVDLVVDRTAEMPQRARWRTPSWWAGRIRVGDGLGGPLPSAVRIAIVALLVAALLATIGVVGALLQRRQTEPTGLTSGTWQADQPLSMNFGDPSGPATLRLIVTNDDRLLVSSSSHGVDPVDWLGSSIVVERPGIVRLTTTAWTNIGRGRNDGVAADLNDGAGRRQLDPCAEGDSGRYQWSDEPSRRWRTMTSLGDACEARQAVLTGGRGATRTWFAAATLDGRATAIFDGFTPKIAVTLPGDAQYTLSSTSSSDTAEGGDVTVRAFLDPYPFRDPCDARSGWMPRSDGGADLIDVLAGSPAFVVTDQRSGSVSGRTAHFARVEAASPNPCGDRINGAWQGGHETTGVVRSILPGEHVFLALASGPTWTVLFDITLAADPPEPAQAEEILASVRFEP
jgi:hypothetical protein